MVKLLRDLPDNCTTSEIVELCDDLDKQGHQVVIEHKGGRILLYDAKTDSSEVGMLKSLYQNLLNDAPEIGSENWQEYEDTLVEIEAQLRAAGVEI